MTCVCLPWSLRGYRPLSISMDRPVTASLANIYHLPCQRPDDDNQGPFVQLQWLSQILYLLSLVQSPSGAVSISSRAGAVLALAYFPSAAHLNEGEKAPNRGLANHIWRTISRRLARLLENICGGPPPNKAKTHSPLPLANSLTQSICFRASTDRFAETPFLVHRPSRIKSCALSTVAPEEMGHR